MLLLEISKKVTIMTHDKAIDKSPQTIHTMFNMLAQNYDKINNIMSFGTHKIAKFKSLSNLNIKPHDNILDLCCGTGDLSNMLKQIQPDCCVTGMDFSEQMLKIARNKNSNIKFIQGDATDIPFYDNSFDIVTMGFGLRNIQNAEKAVEEIYRILKPKGQFLHLDFGKKNLITRIHNKLIPLMVNNFTDTPSAYKYLVKSKEIFPEPKDLIKDFESKGFKLQKREDYFFGVISSQIMVKL